MMMKKNLCSVFILLCAALTCCADKALERMKSYRVDQVIAGNEVSERLHHLTAKNSMLVKGRDDVLARTTAPGGSFFYTLKAPAEGEAAFLHVRYSGDDRSKPGLKNQFQVLGDGKVLDEQELNRNMPNGFLDEFYPLPPEILKGRKELKIGFAAINGKSYVGDVYAVSILRDKRPDEYSRMDLLDNWHGLQCKSSFAGLGRTFYEMKVPGCIVFTEPDGPRGWYPHGWQKLSDNVMNWTELWGLELKIDNRTNGSLTLKFIAGMEALPKEDRDTGNISRSINVELSRPGTQTVLLPFKDFVNPTANVSDVLYKVKTLTLEAIGSGNIIIDSVRVLKGYPFAVETSSYSKPGKAGSEVSYTLKVTNTSQEPQSYNLCWIQQNWEGMKVKITPERLDIMPGASATADVKVHISAKIPQGGKEYQNIRVTPEGKANDAQTVRLITFVDKDAPFILHDRKGWDEVRAKAAKYPWAAKRKQEYIDQAEKWRVPEVRRFGTSPDTKRRYLVHMHEEHKLMNAAIAWQLTGDKKYAEKAALFLLRISDPLKGFPKTRQVGHQSEVQEGHMFQHIAIAYDMISDSGVLSADDRKQIDATLQLYCDMIKQNNQHPAGANWAVSTQLGALFCALALKDLHQAELFTFGPGMLCDKLSSYTMSDGWWYECSISYNLWCAEEFVQMAMAMERFGYSLLNRKYPVNFSNVPDIQYDDETELNFRRNVHYGHSFRIFGNIENNSITIKQMFDAMIPYIDYRGWIFGINDSTENNVGGGRFEIAYYAFRDPAYAAFLKTAKERTNLLYGVGELPDITPEIGKGSAYSDNVGLVMLRSNQKEPRERIQAVLKYGTHGGYHGHYDRTGLLSLMRYGRSFFNPEMIWYSYQPFMYNFYVQSSIAKNMVTVDGKQQEVDDSSRVIFHEGKLFQAGAVETESRWSYPGYGGLRWGHIGFPTFSSKTVAEGRYVPIPDPEPRYGSMSGFTEKILQRRLMILTDDYVVLSDYIRGGEQHDYDLLFQIKGLLGIDGNVKKTHHAPQLDTDPLKSTQFITDVNFYRGSGSICARFLTKYGPGADNRGTRIYGEDGDLYMNVYYAYPNNDRILFTGLAPENHGVNRKLSYKVKGDGKVLASGAFGAWILGDAKIDVPLKDVKTLELSAAIEGRGKVNTLFWADASIETADGRQIPLTKLKAEKINVLDSKFPPTLDYQGGKINIAGRDYNFGLPADPGKTGENKPAIYRFDLSGLDAVRLKTVVGGDYPVGNEAERRITIGMKTKADKASFLTVIEPFEQESVIQSVEAATAESLTVKLKDGRVHQFTISGMNKEKSEIKIEMREIRDGKTVTETAHN
jgi:hypothetical protein